MSLAFLVVGGLAVFSGMCTAGTASAADCVNGDTSGSCLWHTGGAGSNSPGVIEQGNNEFNLNVSGGGNGWQGWLKTGSGYYACHGGVPVVIPKDSTGVLCTGVLGGTHEHVQQASGGKEATTLLFGSG